MTDPAFREAVREGIARAYGPAADDAEMASCIAARAEADAREAAYAADRRSLAGALARQLSEMLPEGMRFEWK